MSRGGGGGGSAVVIRVKQYMWCSEGVHTCADIWSDLLDYPGLTAILKIVKGGKC